MIETKYYVNGKEFTDIKEAEEYETKVKDQEKIKSEQEKEKKQMYEDLRKKKKEYLDCLKNFKDKFGYYPTIIYHTNESYESELMNIFKGIFNWV